MNRQNNCTDVDPSLKVVAAEVSETISIHSTPAAYNLVLCGIVPSIASISPQAVYTHQMMSFARDGVSRLISSEGPHRSSPRGTELLLSLALG